MQSNSPTIPVTKVELQRANNTTSALPHMLTLAIALSLSLDRIATGLEEASSGI